jgi:hypothetical protein
MTFEYPGLRDRVNIYTIDARVHGLPDIDAPGSKWRWHPVSMGTGAFSTSKELQLWLAHEEGGYSGHEGGHDGPRVDLSLWGKDGGKTASMEDTVARLWHELEQSESKLTFDEEEWVVRRQVSVAKVVVRHPDLPGRVLINTSVAYPDGKVKRKDKLLSEKLKAHEDIKEGAKRAILEELGSVVGVEGSFGKGGSSNGSGGQGLEHLLTVDEHSQHYSEEVSPSSTYPGMAQLYCLFQVDVLVAGLPTEGFESSEWKDETRRVLKHRLRWEWKQEADVASLLQQ